MEYSYEPVSYAPFVLTDVQIAEKEIARKLKHEQIVKKRDEYVRCNSLRLLKSDYLNCSSYYYNDITDTILEHENINGMFKQITNDVNLHLRQLNSL